MNFYPRARLKDELPVAHNHWLSLVYFYRLSRVFPRMGIWTIFRAPNCFKFIIPSLRRILSESVDERNFYDNDKERRELAVKMIAQCVVKLPVNASHCLQAKNTSTQNKTFMFVFLDEIFRFPSYKLCRGDFRLCSHQLAGVREKLILFIFLLVCFI